MEPDNLRRSWYAIRTGAGPGPDPVQDLRHTSVTLLLDTSVTLLLDHCVPPHVIRDIAGHSDIEVTMTIYAHVSLDEKSKALRKLGNALG